MLQKQHTKQIALMTATNKASMDAMMERMNALMVDKGGIQPTHQDMEITPTVGNILPTSTIPGTNQTKKRGTSAYVPIAKCLFSTNPKTVLNLR
jgi:hypothetical protein